jgi:hypothetical protein
MKDGDGRFREPSRGFLYNPCCCGGYIFYIHTLKFVIPAGLSVGAADGNDIALVEATMENVPVLRPLAAANVHLCLDKGLRGYSRIQAIRSVHVRGDGVRGEGTAIPLRVSAFSAREFGNRPEPSHGQAHCVEQLPRSPQ